MLYFFLDKQNEKLNYKQIIVELLPSHYFRRDHECYVTSMEQDYDYLSLMHFQPDEYATPNNTVRPKDDSYAGLIGQRVALTKNDIQKIDMLYRYEVNINSSLVYKL